MISQALELTHLAMRLKTSQQEMFSFETKKSCEMEPWEDRTEFCCLITLFTSLVTLLISLAIGEFIRSNIIEIKPLLSKFHSLSASSETRRKLDNGPLKLELQVQPTVAAVPPRPYPIGGQQNIASASSTTPFPDPLETVRPQPDPALAAAIYQQHQINLHPTYSPFRDRDVLDPATVNALLHHQYFQPQNQNPYGYRQNIDGSVSTYSVPTSSQNRPPFFNWFGSNSNNNNNNYQSDQQQQGPVLGFLTNLAQNNPITSFINNLQPQNDQQQNPFQSFISNLNPFNLFSNNNNNRPQQSITLPSLQSDYVSTLSPVMSGNIDSVFSTNDHFLNPNQFTQNGNLNPYGQGLQVGNFNPNLGSNFNPNLNIPLQSANFNPPYSTPTPIYNPNYSQGSYLTTTNRPGYNNQQFSNANVIPYSQLYVQNRPGSSYPIYQNPYQTISPISLIPNYNQKKKTGNKTGKRKNNKNKVDIPDSDSDWFPDFLEKRKEASLDVSSKRPHKKASDEDDDADLDDYFRWTDWSLLMDHGLF